MIHLDIPQLSEEWFQARIGVPSASCFDKIVTTQGKRSAQYKQYLYQLAGERTANTKAESYANAAMQRGVELEAEARRLYEMIRDVEVQEVGICYPDEDRRYSCSPDGLVGGDGGVEIKCPLIHTHVEYLLGQKLPTKYIQQVQGSLHITGRNWWDFFSYYPGLKPLLVRVYPDKMFLPALYAHLQDFIAELDGVVEKLKSL